MDNLLNHELPVIHEANDHPVLHVLKEFELALVGGGIGETIL